MEPRALCTLGSAGPTELYSNSEREYLPTLVAGPDRLLMRGQAAMTAF